MTVRFRKRPIEIEATQWTGRNLAELRAWTGGEFEPVHVTDRVEDPEITAEVYDELHSTWVGVKDGQWILRGVKGEFYPCDEEVLAETYETIDPEPPAPECDVPASVGDVDEAAARVEAFLPEFVDIPDESLATQRGTAMFAADIRAVAADRTRLLAEVEKLTDRVIAAETNRVDAADLKRENDDLRATMAEVTSETAIAKLREWTADGLHPYAPGAPYIAMPVANACKVIGEIDALQSSGDQGATREHTLLAERLHARKIARIFIGYIGLPGARWLFARNGLDGNAVPDWLTADAPVPDAKVRAAAPTPEPETPRLKKGDRIAVVRNVRKDPSFIGCHGVIISDYIREFGVLLDGRDGVIAFDAAELDPEHDAAAWSRQGADGEAANANLRDLILSAEGGALIVECRNCGAPERHSAPLPLTEVIDSHRCADADERRTGAQ